MLEDLIKLDDLLREFWQGFFENFPLRDLFWMLAGTSVLALILMAI